jgi:cell division protein CrgA
MAVQHARGVRPVPKSRIRRRSVFTPPPTDAQRKAVHVGSPPWLVPLMVGCFVLGLLWVVVYYVTQTDYPIGSIGIWNMGIGFGLIIVGFGLSTRWK